MRACLRNKRFGYSYVAHHVNRLSSDETGYVTFTDEVII